MKITNDNKRIILQVLDERNKLNVLEVAELIGASEATARRLCVKLEEEGHVIRTFGGIQAKNSKNFSYSFIASASTCTKEKTAIGNRAALEVMNGDYIFLDSGTTVLAMAKALVQRIKEEKLEKIKIVTNSLILTDLLIPHCKIILIGGEIRPERMDTCGVMAENMLKHLHVQKAFLGCDALNLEKGLMTTDERTARINEIVINNASSIYILADATKIGKTSFISYGDLNIIDAYIVDNSIPSDIATNLYTRIKKLIIAE